MTHITTPLSQEFLNTLTDIKKLNSKLYAELDLHKEIEDFDITTLELLSQQQEAQIAELLADKFEQQHQLYLPQMNDLVNECKDIENLLKGVLDK